MCHPQRVKIDMSLFLHSFSKTTVTLPENVYEMSKAVQHVFLVYFLRRRSSLYVLYAKSLRGLIIK